MNITNVHSVTQNSVMSVAPNNVYLPHLSE